mgnify:FL=1
MKNRQTFWITLLISVFAAGCARGQTRGREDAVKAKNTPAGPSDSSAQTPYVKPGPQELIDMLTPEQYAVTQQNATEPPFRNAYWDHYHPGIYVDIVSGEPLFSSLDKFDSGTGWPSFSKPLQADSVIEVVDNSHGMSRIEVRSKQADSHLGHVFEDGPEPERRRFCINSAALRFVPA